VIIGQRLWERQFNRDPAVIGKPLTIGDDRYTIVGVLPPGFRGMSGRAEALVSLMAEPAEWLTQVWSHSFSAVGRLRAGVTPAAAIAAAEVAGAEVDRTFPDPQVATDHWGATARTLDATRVDPVVRRSLIVLLAAVALVLLIACANVANLFLVRSAGRRREIAVRLAVGAGRRRLVRQLLTESLLLAAIGGAASLFVAWGGVTLLSRLDPTEALRVQRLTGIGAVDFGSIRLDLPALGFASLLVIVTGLLFGLVPALQSTKLSLTDGLKDGNRSAGGLRGAAIRNALTVFEIALALVLLAGSGLMLKSLGRLLGVQPGFAAEQVLSLRLNTRDGFSRDSMPLFYDQLLERLGTIPGVASVGLADCPPLSGGCNGTSIVLRDQPPPKPGTERSVGIHWISPSWPATMRVPLQQGRALTSADRVGQRKVVLVNETAARTFWPGQSAIGRPVSVGQGGFWKDTAYVAGVIGDVRYHTLDSVPRPDVYLSYYQSPRGRMMLFLRTAGDPMTFARTVTGVIRELAPDLPVYDVQSMDSRVALAVAPARFSALLLAIFAAVALALAALGIYGVISFAVSQRTREIGIRTALGADRADVVRMVVGHGVTLAAIGALIGVGMALGTTRVLRSLLFEVTPSDPVTFIAIVVLVAAVAMLASWLPARRAARVEPVEALHNE
jgi:putative ABC transport system permease protein